jgi:endonuclease I
MILIVLIAFVSLSGFSAPLHYDTYREELAAITKENHRSVRNYSYARTIVMQQMHLDSDEKGYFVKDVYCEKKFRDVSPSQMPDHNFVNIEHTWPQSRFNKRSSQDVQKTDLHHLYPTDSKANGKRGSHVFTEFSRSMNGLSNCKASSVGRTENGTAFEPPDAQKGNVARALFYFAVRYNMKIKEYEEIHLRLWNVLDPVDEQEMLRNNVAEKYQGNRNPFIDDPQFADLISNF